MAAEDVTETLERLNEHVTLTRLVHGPFCVVITDPEDAGQMLVVQPRGGYPTKAEALQFAQQFAGRKRTYLGMHFRVEQLSTPAAFVQYCSWED
jgi:hypothetical protein